LDFGFWTGRLGLGAKEVQHSNGKWQMANGRPFEICHLPFAI
jgi:hypothetical protein